MFRVPVSKHCFGRIKSPKGPWASIWAPIGALIRYCLNALGDSRNTTPKCLESRSLNISDERMAEKMRLFSSVPPAISGITRRTYCPALMFRVPVSKHWRVSSQVFLATSFLSEILILYGFICYYYGIFCGFLSDVYRCRDRKSTRLNSSH